VAELERDDVTLIVAGIFDVNRRLGRIGQDVRAIRQILEEDDEEEEEADNG
jgi:hypothetical protein